MPGINKESGTQNYLFIYYVIHVAIIFFEVKHLILDLAFLNSKKMQFQIRHLKSITIHFCLVALRYFVIRIKSIEYVVKLFFQINNKQHFSSRFRQYFSLLNCKQLRSINNDENHRQIFALVFCFCKIYLKTNCNKTVFTKYS